MDRTPYGQGQHHEQGTLMIRDPLRIGIRILESTLLGIILGISDSPVILLDRTLGKGQQSQGDGEGYLGLEEALPSRAALWGLSPGEPDRSQLAW